MITVDSNIKHISLISVVQYDDNIADDDFKCNFVKENG